MPDFTVCVLLYGDYSELARRCLTPLWELAESGQIDLRIGCNDIGRNTLDYLNQVDTVVDRDHYRVIRSPENKRKYPMMRELFALGPLSPYTMWLDDDSVVSVKQNPSLWLSTIAAVMDGNDQAGQVWYKTLEGNQALWVKSQPWYTGKEVQDRHKVSFCTGGWWVIRSQILIDWNWPSPDIYHRGGDVMLGELMRQQGLRMVSRFPGVLVNAALGSSEHCSSPRRGYDSKPVGWDFVPHKTNQKVEAPT